MGQYSGPHEAWEEDFDDFLSRIDAVGEISLARPLSRHGACRENARIVTADAVRDKRYNTNTPP